MSLTAVALNCTIKSGGEASSTELMLTRLVGALGEHGVETGPIIRVVDEGIAFGVTSDEGDGDGWPAIRAKILDAQILVIGTPIWLGNPSSVCRQVLERLDAFISEEDDRGRPIAYDRVAVLATVGNEDGAHNVAAQVYQALTDVGFTIPAGGQTYWVGEAMGSVDYKDLDPEPEKVASTNRDVARNAAHLARVLQASPYPAPS
jgi:multimeric flavodoxin WrbA